MIDLYDHQIEAFSKLKTGSILKGGVGSGKSRTAIAYYFIRECGGSIKINGQGQYKPPKKQKDLYIITTAKKRDSLEWEEECLPFNLKNVKIDSWNNIKKYIDIKNAFFIFDEQKVIGSGTWVKSFLKIVKNNNWILLSATPGDTWMDYVPVFIANGFYKNRTEFTRRHVVYNRFVKFPKIDRYIDTGILIKYRNKITVDMKFKRSTRTHSINIKTDYNKSLYNKVLNDRWNVYKEKPIRNITEMIYLLRKIVNSDASRLKEVIRLFKKHKKIIIFYNFNYELDLLKDLCEKNNICYSEWNGHKHEELPRSNKWCYLVQYTSGAEGWNCIETDTIIFYSQNYSYKNKIQAAGRIDRLNTPFIDLYNYHLKSDSSIDQAIYKTLRQKKNFNDKLFMSH